MAPKNSYISKLSNAINDSSKKSSENSSSNKSSPISYRSTGFGAGARKNESNYVSAI